MEITYKNYTINEDARSFILTEFWFRPDNDKDGNPNPKAGEKYIVSQVYPSTLFNCIDRIMHKEKKNKDAVIELTKAADELKKINEQFINDIALLLKETLWKSDNTEPSQTEK